MAGGKTLCLPEKDSGSTLGFLFFTTKTYASKNASTLSKLDAALAKANDYANANPAALQQQEATDAELNATVQAKLRVETYTNNITSADLQPMMTLLLKYKVITTPVDLTTALFANAS
jgi:ABC-type nitrate/sulfonate/bicarbonate transport system substrate-binding protein